MPTETASIYLEKEIESSIKKIKQKSKDNKRKTRIINVLSISLGALITLTLGVEIGTEYSAAQKNLALILGASLTIVNGWNALFDYKKFWIRQKSTLLDLYQIKNELGYRKAIGNDSEVDDIFEKYQQMWEMDGKEWKKIIRMSSRTQTLKSEPTQ